MGKTFECSCGNLVAKNYLEAEIAVPASQYGRVYVFQCGACGQHYTESVKDAIALDKKPEYGEG